TRIDSLDVREAPIDPVESGGQLGESSLELARRAVCRGGGQKSADDQTGERADDGADGPGGGIDLGGEAPAHERPRHPQHRSSSRVAADVDVASLQDAPSPEGNGRLLRAHERCETAAPSGHVVRWIYFLRSPAIRRVETRHFGAL